MHINSMMSNPQRLSVQSPVQLVSKKIEMMTNSRQWLSSRLSDIINIRYDLIHDFVIFFKPLMSHRDTWFHLRIPFII